MRPRPNSIPDDWHAAGQSLAIGHSLLVMVALGVVIGLVQPYMSRMNDARNEHVTNEAATQGMDWTFQIWTNLPFVVISVLVLGTIVVAVFRRRGVMSRFFDLLALLLALVLIFTTQFAAGLVLDPMRDQLLEQDIEEKYNAEQNFDDMYVAVVQWVPMAASIGLIVVVVFREYRRQRTTARGGGLR